MDKLQKGGTNRKKRRAGNYCKSFYPGRTHCKHGHLLAILGVTKAGYCKACSRAQAKRSARKMLVSGKRYQGFTRTIIKKFTADEIDHMVDAVRNTGRMASAAPLAGASGVNKLKALCHFYPHIGDRFKAEMTKRVVVDGKIILQAKHRPFKSPPNRPIILLPSVRQQARILAPSFNPDLTVDHAIFAEVRAAIPHFLPRDMRDDIAGEMLLAYCEGKLRRVDILSAVRKFVSRSYSADHNKFGPRSLDEPAFRESATPLIETISRGLWQ